LLVFASAYPALPLLVGQANIRQRELVVAHHQASRDHSGVVRNVRPYHQNGVEGGGGYMPDCAIKRISEDIGN